MAEIGSNNKSVNYGTIKFGTLGQKIPLNCNGVKKETIVKDDNSVFNKLWNSFNKNGDNYLDALELKDAYEMLNNYQKDGKIDKEAVRTMGSQLNIENLDIKDLEQFTKALANENDEVSSRIEGGRYVEIDDGNKFIEYAMFKDQTYIIEFSDDKHTERVGRTRKAGNITATERYTENGSEVTTTEVNGDDVVLTRVEQRNKYNERLEAVETKNDGTKKIISFSSDIIQKIVEQDEQGNTVRTIVYNDDNTCTVTTEEGTQTFDKSEFPTGEEKIVRRYNAVGYCTRQDPVNGKFIF